MRKRPKSTVPASRINKKELIRKFVDEPLLQIPKLQAEMRAIEKRLVAVRDPTSIKLEHARINQIEKTIKKIHSESRDNEKKIRQAVKREKELNKKANIPTPYGTTGWASVTYGKPLRG